MNSNKSKNKQLFYLAQPYSKYDNKDIPFQLACKVVAKYLKMNVFLFSPIVHSHPVSDFVGNKTKFSFWEEYDKLMIDKCNAMIILTVPGWKESVGVTAELKYAKSKDMPIHYLEPKQLIFNKELEDD